MRTNRFFAGRPRIVPVLVAVLLIILSFSPPATTQELPPSCPDPLFDPYIFLILDTSGSMNFSPPCSQTQLDAGECTLLCPTGNCFVPLQGDDPASKFYQLKEGLQTFLASNPQAEANLGFASYNQDTFSVRAKHWLYEAQSGGPVIPGWGAYPAAGAREVFGFNWGCDTGSGDSEIGCLANKPADLPDAWELSRMQRLPKAGSTSLAVTFYLRSGTSIYRTTYSTPVSAATGATTMSVNVRIDRCSNIACSATTAVGQTPVTWTRSAEFISWDNGFSTGPSRTNPELSYFSYAAMDAATSSNTCGGWDPNTDTTADRFNNNYDLRWPTNSSDPRGALFTVGDVIPLDWQVDHNLDIQKRLAPSLILGLPPSYGAATYLRDTPSLNESFLRLKTEQTRPLIASGSTPLGAALTSFRTWYTGCATGSCPPAGWYSTAVANDPDWLCRRKAVVLLVDGDDTCGVDPCPIAASLWTNYGVQTYVVGFGADPASSPQLDCVAWNGGTGSPYRPQTKAELAAALEAIFTAARTP